MALLEIIVEGDPRLRQKASRIRTVDPSIRRLASDMRETMMDAPGVGLAAPQVGILLRMITVYLPADFEKEGEPEHDYTLINPEIVKSDGRVMGYEGCLSIPGWTGDVPRAKRVTVKAIDLNGKQTRLKLEGWIARVVQHEIDHLDGILFVDRVEDKSTIQEIPEEDGEVDGILT
ncbi:MAG: peptide deformylase [Ilumatobacteraceae bacterium]